MKKLLLTSSFLLLSMGVNAQVTQPSQLFFGEKTAENSCGEHGRLALTSEIEAMTDLCDHITSPWSIWKVEGPDGSFWSLLGSGSGYNCQVKAGVNPNVMSVCATKEEANTNTAYLFAKNEYAGLHAWDGKPLVASLGDENPQTAIKSFKLGEGVRLVGFSEENYSGQRSLYESSRSNLAQTIKSYKLESAISNKFVTFNYVSDTNYKTCLKIIAPGQGMQTLCSDRENNPIVLTAKPAQEMMLNIAVYEERFQNTNVPESTVGQIFLNFDREGDFTVDSSQLQQGVSVLKDKNTLNFTSH